MEYVGTKSRSSMGIVQQLPFAFGYMLMAVYAYYVRDWHNLMLSFSVTGLALFSYFWYFISQTITIIRFSCFSFSILI